MRSNSTVPFAFNFVNAAISQGVTGKAVAKLDANIAAYALPPLYYGKSNEHCHFPGTIMLSDQTLLAVIGGIADSIYRAGFQKLMLMNADGGQPQVMEIAARDIHQKYHDFSVFGLFVRGVPNLAAELLIAKELEFGIHAGDAETSLMLSILPARVKMELAVTEYPKNLQIDSFLSMEGNLPFAWLTRELTESGVLGDATVATEEKGARILESLSDKRISKVVQAPAFIRGVNLKSQISNLKSIDAALAFVGVPDPPLRIPLFSRMAKRRRIMASPIGGRAMINEMLAIAEKFGIEPIVEVFAIAQANEAMQKVRDNQVLYRAVLTVS